MNPGEGAGPILQPPPSEHPYHPPTSSLVIAVLVDNFQMALLQGLEKVKQEVLRMGGRWTNQGKHRRGHRGWREGRKAAGVGL